MMERTLDEGCFEVGRPYDLALALDCLPAFPAGDDSLDGIIDTGGGGDRVGEVVGGGDVDVLGEVVAVVGGHGGWDGWGAGRRERRGTGYEKGRAGREEEIIEGLYTRICEKARSSIARAVPDLKTQSARKEVLRSWARSGSESWLGPRNSDWF